MCAEPLLYLMSVLTANLSKIKEVSLRPDRIITAQSCLARELTWLGLVGWRWSMAPSQYAQEVGRGPVGRTFTATSIGM